MMRAKYDDKIHILLAGDANKFPITPVLNSYGQLRQICSIPTRKNATLELIITDLWGLYHPPSSMPPLKVDQDKKGKDSDHAIIIFAPKSNDKFYLKSQQKVIKFRPLPDSKILEFGKIIANTSWKEIYASADVDEMVSFFHQTIRTHYEKICPEKTIKISVHDQNWFSPDLKILYRKMQREYAKNRRSAKYKGLKCKLQRKKRYAIKRYFIILSMN